MTPKETHDDMIQTLIEDSPLYTTVKKSVMEFKYDRDSTNGSQFGCPKTSTLEEQVDEHCMILNKTLLTRFQANLKNFYCRLVTQNET